MKRPNLFVASIAAALILLPGPVLARGYYFNRPGVSREAYMADVGECIELAGGVRPSNQYIPYSPNLIATGVVAFFAGMARSRERRRLGSIVERTCMADKGYTRYEVENSVLDEIEDLHSTEARADRLFGLAASGAPVGRRAPE
jgi:hypothetical protein